MDALEDVEVDCPYCGEAIELLVDGSGGSQTYVEDCPVCCRPMTVEVTVGSIASWDVDEDVPPPPAIAVSVRREDD
jgi:hypothetical protein